MKINMASVQSDQSLRCSITECMVLHLSIVTNVDSDKNIQMRTLISVYAGSTSHMGRFLC